MKKIINIKDFLKDFDMVFDENKNEITYLFNILEPLGVEGKSLIEKIKKELKKGNTEMVVPGFLEIIKKASTSYKMKSGESDQMSPELKTYIITIILIPTTILVFLLFYIFINL